MARSRLAAAPRARLVFSSLTLCLTACAASPVATVAPSRALDLSPASAPVDDADLVVPRVTAAGPTGDADPCPSPRCGRAGAPGDVRLDDRRDEALDVFVRYVRAVSARDADAVRALLDDEVRPAREGPAVPRETVINLHTRLFDLMDVRGFEASLVRVSSYERVRQQGRGLALAPGDWLVEWTTTSFRAGASPLAVTHPTMMVLRWREGTARVACFSPEFLARNAAFAP